MPVLNSQNMTTHQIDGTGYTFSAKRIDELGASEYTLVLLVVDVSSSVIHYRKQIEDCVKEAIKACKQSPRADNLMLRMVLFNGQVQEFHGFLPLTECDLNNYMDSIQPSGTTALFDATYDGVESAVRYAKDLTDNDFDVNGIIIVITDGEDNSSSMTPKSVGDSFVEVYRTESMESMVSILVGINHTNNQGLSNYLQRFKDEAGFTQYVEIGDASAKTLARLADFVSRSISSQSQALGTGGASQSLSF